MAAPAQQSIGRCVICSKPLSKCPVPGVSTCSLKCAQALQAIAAKCPLPDGPYDLLYADPPWHFHTYSDKGQGRSASRHYSTMPIDALKQLPIGDIAAPNSVMVMWVYDPLLPECIEVMQAWGFQYVTRLFTWVKIARDGSPRMGTGYYSRRGSETAILGKRGKGLKRHSKSVREVIMAPRREHSRKPDEARDRLEQLFGDVRRIELFARRTAPGWAAWGDAITESVI
jgi:N6-adenosine-specific RNA methylase IME4